MHITTRAAAAAILSVMTLFPVGAPSGLAAQDATPAIAYGCDAAMASPMAGMEGMAMSTPAADDGHDMASQSVEFDQMYIDMMVPHHAGIIALAQAAQERLTDERLQAIADAIITSQSAENDELRGYREEWYGSPESMPMDEAMMGMMMEMMPGMGDMAELRQMDPQALVAACRAGEDPEVTFIDLTIQRHEMAIAA